MSTPLSFPLVSFPLALAPPSEAGLFLQGDAKASKQESLPPPASAALPNRSARARSTRFTRSRIIARTVIQAAKDWSWDHTLQDRRG
jgi:hypothetical protein